MIVRVHCRRQPDLAQPRDVLEYRRALEPYQDLFRTLWELETPVISAVNGTVAGVGWMLALLADLVVAAENARWTHVFTRRGMTVMTNARCRSSAGRVCACDATGRARPGRPCTAVPPAALRSVRRPGIPASRSWRTPWRH